MGDLRVRESERASEKVGGKKEERDRNRQQERGRERKGEGWG
jgi:hypothetical protein